jgi:hypothetical protein
LSWFYIVARGPEPWYCGCNCGCDAALKSFKKLFIVVAAFAVADHNLKLWIQ